MEERVGGDRSGSNVAGASGGGRRSGNRFSGVARAGSKAWSVEG